MFKKRLSAGLHVLGRSKGADGDPIEKGEMKRIQKRLDEGESIVMSVRQSRIKPGGQP
ncbi:MAG: hypothetical protein MPL62_15230 [Alphaproteobacteria bacterium]|nr:hypothetical protein [Alphaproteobacteria bacterium]